MMNKVWKSNRVSQVNGNCYMSATFIVWTHQGFILGVTEILRVEGLSAVSTCSGYPVFHHSAFAMELVSLQATVR